MEKRTKIWLIGGSIGVVVIGVLAFIYRKQIKGVATKGVKKSKSKLSSFKQGLVEKANSEWKRFGEPTRDKNGKWVKTGARETDEGFWQRVGDYWKQGTGHSYTGKDRNQAWSSAFISWVMKSTDPNKRFVYSSSHSKYIRDSIKNRKENRLNEPFVGYKIAEKPVEIGDLVCYTRQGGVGYDTTSRYKSHCDLVVAKDVGNQEVEVIGGNVNQTVGKKKLSINKDGFLTDTHNDWFAILKNNA